MSRHNLSLDQLTFHQENGPSSHDTREEPRNTTPSNAYYWPDISSETNNTDPLAGSGVFGYQFSENQMDFSLSHFIKTVTKTVPQPEKQFEDSPPWGAPDDLWNPQPLLWEQPSSLPVLAWNS